MNGEQAQQDSPLTEKQIEDRLTETFEPSDPPRPEETEVEQTEESAPEMEEIEIDGEKLSVPTKFKEAFIRQSDYTSKTREVADARRQIELQSEAFRIAGLERDFEATIAEPIQNLAVLESREKHLLANWMQLSTDEKQELLYITSQKQSIQRDVDSKKNEFQQGQMKALNELRSKAFDAAKKSIPNWSDAMAKDITEHAISDGYTQQELSSITDPRHIKTLWKAREYDKLKAKATAKPSIPAVVKPGPSNTMPQKVKDNLAFRKQMDKAQTATQKARLIEERFAKQFGG